MSIISNLLRKKPLPGKVGDEEGFLDIDLPLVSVQIVDDGSRRFVALGTISDVEMGFAVTLGTDWHPKQTDDGAATFYWGLGSFERTGVESDNFVRFVAMTYGLPVSGDQSMIQNVHTEVVGLGSNPAGAVQAGAKMKFFFHSDSEERYAEVFVNVDVEQGFLEFHEKDNEYRAPLVRALTEASQETPSK
jgi:hypothetical protein